MSARVKNLRLFLAVFILFSVALLGLAHPKRSFAEDSTSSEETAFEKAYSDYENQISEYNSAHSDYILRRSQYLRFKTLQSQQDAFDATSKMLQERDDVNISYLKIVKERLNESVGIDEKRKSDLNVRLDDEIGWFTDHRNGIHTAGTLEDLVGDSLEAEGKYNLEYPLFYEVLSVISSGKITDYDERLNDIFEQLKRKFDEIKTEQRDDYKFSGDKLQQLDRWVFDADSRILRAGQKQVEAEEELEKIKTQPHRATYVYDSVMSRLEEARQFLKESGNYLTEIVRSIKTKED